METKENMEMKKRIILSALRRNGRESLTSIHKLIGLPITTIFEYLQKLKQGNTIKKFSVILDFSAIGYPIKLNALFKIKPENRNEFIEFITNNYNTNNFYKINNGYNFFIQFLFHTIIEAEEFLNYLDLKFAIIDKKIFYVIETYKEESFFSNPHVLYMKEKL